MEASLVDQPQLKQSPLAEQAVIEQAPKIEPSTLQQHTDSGRLIEHQVLQELPKESLPDKNASQDHHIKNSPIQTPKDSSFGIGSPSGKQQEMPFEESSDKITFSQHHHDNPSFSNEHTTDSLKDKILMESPSEDHHTKPSPIQEREKETCIEKNVVGFPSERLCAEPSIAKEYQQGNSLMDLPAEHVQSQPSSTEAHHNVMDNITQQQHTKQLDHHKSDSSPKILDEHCQGEPVTDVYEEGTLVENSKVGSQKVGRDDHNVEKSHLLKEQASIALSRDEKHQGQNRKDEQEKTDPAVDISSQRQQDVKPKSDKPQISLIDSQNQVTQPSEKQPLLSDTKQHLNESLQHSTNMLTGHRLHPSIEQHEPEKEVDGELLVRERFANPSIGLSQPKEHTTQPLVTTTTIAEVHGESADESMTKQPQTFSSRLQKPSRAEIDTAAPFESVKAAVSLFGARMDWKSQARMHQMQAGSSTETSMLPEAELRKAQEELVHYKEKLALTQASTAGVLLELRKMKQLIQNPVSKHEVMDNLPHKYVEAPNASKRSGAASLEKPANRELQAVLRELESVKEDLDATIIAKEKAGKELHDAVSSLNTVSKRVNELSAEKGSLDEALTDAHIALADAEEQVELLRAGHKVDSINNVPSDFMEKKSAEMKTLESKLGETTAIITKLKEELLASKQAEGVAVAATTEIEQKIVKAKLELEQAKSEELRVVGALAKVLEEIDDWKVKVEKARHDKDTLASTVESLKANEEHCRMELDSMHEKEQVACATLASLQDELHKVKEALQSARAHEVAAVEAKDTLPTAIKQAASDADKAKGAAEASKKEARKAWQEIEQVKAATSTAVSRQQAALKELEAARASEAMASADLKALTESESQGAVTESDVEGVFGVTISLEEYSALKHSALEAEALADKKVAEAMAQVEEAKASQLRAQSKLDDALKEAEKGRDELQRTNKHADDAQEAKLTAEADFRKWRAEHDQRRKSGGAPLDLKAGSPRKLSSDEKGLQPIIYQEKEGIVPSRMQEKRDSLAQVMSLQVPTLDRGLVEDASEGKKKSRKRNLIRRIASIVALKRKP